MLGSQRPPRKLDQQAEAVYVRLLECWLTDSVQGRHLLEDRTLAEAGVTLRKLIGQGLLDMQVIDLPGDQIRIEIFPTQLALTGELEKAEFGDRPGTAPRLAASRKTKADAVLSQAPR